MKACNRILVCIISVSLVACANTAYNPIVDTKGVDSSRYRQDLYDCQTFAKETMSAGDRAVAGAVLGAIVGLALAAAVKDNAFRGQYAAVGALSGAGGGYEGGRRDEKTIVSTCLRNRGYSVLNG